MRLSEDRYWRDLRRLDLAVRMLRLEARLGTVCTWTGLRPDRVKTLARSLTEPPRRDADQDRAPSNARPAPPSPRRPAPVTNSAVARAPHRVGAADAAFPTWLTAPIPRGRIIRHRGQSPRQLAYFSRSVRLRLEAAALASCLVQLEVIPKMPIPDAARRLPNLTRGLALCNAYEAYYVLISEAQITFEYAALLAVGLAQAEELALATCSRCGVLLVIDPLANHRDQCMYCNPAVSATLGKVFHARTSSVGPARTASPAQLALFETDALQSARSLTRSAADPELPTHASSGDDAARPEPPSSPGRLTVPSEIPEVGRGSPEGCPAAPAAHGSFNAPRELADAPA